MQRVPAHQNSLPFCLRYKSHPKVPEIPGQWFSVAEPPRKRTKDDIYGNFQFRCGNDFVHALFYCVAKQGSNPEVQQGVNGARPGQYFFQDGQIAELQLINRRPYPIKVRLLRGQVPGNRRGKTIVLRPFGQQSEEGYQSVSLGVIKVHEKGSGAGRSEGTLRMEVTKVVNDKDILWEESTLIGLDTIEYLVAHKKREGGIEPKCVRVDGTDTDHSV